MSMDIRQEDAIQFTGTDILVSASAGAGKTRVLVERLIKRCLKDHVSMNEILAVTFTKAAAEEMKNRVAGRLQEELQKSADPELTSYINEQMVLLDGADITTIDAFCLKIIEKYYNIIGLDPATTANTMDDSKKNELLTQAFHTAMETYNKDHHEELVNALRFTSPRPEEFTELQDAVMDIITHAENDPDPEEWLSKAHQAAAPVKHFKDIDPEIRKYFSAALMLDVRSVNILLERMYALGDETPKVSKKKELLRNAVNHLQLLYTDLEEDHYDLFRDHLEAISRDMEIPSDKNAIAYSKVRNEMQKKLSSLAGKLFPSECFLKDMNDTSAIIDTLLDLASLTRTTFQQLKTENSCMDFSDMERYAWMILTANDNAVAGLYKKRLKEVMVDEFQDTSVLQNKIIEMLAPKGTIFRVGDVKQSIYRFRQAKPALMRSLMQDPETHQIVLEHNYRSKENIVTFCNVLFDRLMNIPGCADHYDENDTVSIGSPERQALSEPDPINFILIDEPDNSDDEEESADDKTMKAEWIAAKIQEFHKEGRPYKDNAILVRSHNDKNILRIVFDRSGIPYDIDTREGFFKSDLCKTILAFLQYLRDPNDQLALLTVLTSPFYRMTDTELAYLKIDHGTISKGIEEAHPEILEEMQKLRETAYSRSLSELLSAISELNAFYENIPSRDKANFDFLFEKVLRLEQTGSSLQDLITYMESSAEERSSEALSRSVDDDVVTVTTIHQSKGLQYPIVYLWSTGQNMMQDTKDSVLVDDELYVAVKHMSFPERMRRTTPARIALEYKNNVEDLEEFTRLLYVALTRAEEKLFIVDMADKSVPYEEAMELPVIARRKGMTGLVSAAMKDTPGLFRIIHTDPVHPVNGVLPSIAAKTEMPYFHGHADMLDPVFRPSDTENLSYLPDLSPNDITGTSYGTKIHEILQYLPDRVWTEEDLEEYRLSKGDMQKLLNFAQSDLYRECLQMEIHKEFPFYVEDTIGKQRIFGSMDFVAIDKEKIILIDYKTDAADPEEIHRRYRAQISTYRHALELLYPDHVIEAYMWSFHNHCSIPL